MNPRAGSFRLCGDHQTVGVRRRREHRCRPGRRPPVGAVPGAWASAGRTTMGAADEAGMGIAGAAPVLKSRPAWCGSRTSNSSTMRRTIVRLWMASNSRFFGLSYAGQRGTPRNAGKVAHNHAQGRGRQSTDYFEADYFRVTSTRRTALAQAGPWGAWHRGLGFAISRKNTPHRVQAPPARRRHGRAHLSLDTAA